MRKRLQGLAIGLIIGILLTSGIAFGENLSKKAELFYNNIKIYIDGAEIVPKDANGNIVEPFIMDGTTYLPVRAISNAFEKDVEWDGETQSVYIGKKDQTKPDNYLSKMDCDNFICGDNFQWSKYSVINGTITDYNNNTYTNGIILDDYYIEPIEEDNDDAHIILSYTLNGRYKNLRGKIVLPKSYDISVWGEKDDLYSTATDVWFYGDGKLLDKKSKVTASKSVGIDVDVSGVNQLEIKIKTSSFSYKHNFVALTDLALYK